MGTCSRFSGLKYGSLIRPVRLYTVYSRYFRSSTCRDHTSGSPGVREGRGAMALAVYRGKMSEGAVSLTVWGLCCRTSILGGLPKPQKYVN